MKERINYLWETREADAVKRMSIDEELIIKYFNENKTTLVNDFISVLKNCFKEMESSICFNLSYMTFSFLNAEFILEGYDLQINFYNQKNYLEQCDIGANYSYKWVIPFFNESVLKLEESLRPQVQRYTKYDSIILRWKYKENFLLPMIYTVLNALINDKLTIAFLKNKIPHFKNIKILFGYKNNWDSELTIVSEVE